MATVFPWIWPNRNKQAIHATHLYSADRHSSRPPPEFNDCGNDSAAGDDDHRRGFQRSTEAEICNQCTIPIGEAEQKDSSKKPDDGFQGPLIEFDFDNQSRMPIGEAELQEHLKKPDDWIQRQQSEINSHSTMFNREAEMRGHVKMPNDGSQRPQLEVNSHSTMFNREAEMQGHVKMPNDGSQRPQLDVNSHSTMFNREAEMRGHVKMPNDGSQRPQLDVNSHSTMFNREAEMRGHVKMPNDGFQRPQPEINSQSTKLDSESEQQDNWKKPDDYGFQRPQKEINSQPIILKSEVYDVETQTKPVSLEKMEELSCKNRPDCIRANMSTPRTDFFKVVVTADGGRPGRPDPEVIDSLLEMEGLKALPRGERKIPEAELLAIQRSIQDYKTRVLHENELRPSLLKERRIPGDSVDTGEFNHIVKPRYRRRAPRPRPEVDMLKVIEELDKIEWPDRKNLPPSACTMCGKDEENHWIGNCPLNPTKIPLYCDICEKDDHLTLMCRYKDFLPVDAKIADGVYLYCDSCGKMGINIPAFRNWHRHCDVRVC